MEELFNSIIEFLLPQNNLYLYLFLFFSAIAENLFPPIPGDTITGLGAFLVGTGRLEYLYVYLITTVGSVIGFMCLFFLGRSLKRDYFIEKDFKFFPAKTIVAAEDWFRRYGLFVVFGNRFLPGIRSVISLVSGISKLSPLKVGLLSLVSAAIWNFIWIHVGFTLGNNWDVVKERLADILKTYNIAVALLMVAALVIFLLVRRARKSKQGEAQ